MHIAHHIKDLTEIIFVLGVVSGFVVSLILGAVIRLARKPTDDQGYLK